MNWTPKSEYSNRRLICILVLQGVFMDTKMLILLVAGGAALVLIIAGVLLNSSSDNQPSRRSAQQTSSGSKLGCIVFVFIVLAIGAGVAVYFIASEKEKSDVRDKYGVQIADICKTPTGVAANRSNLPAAVPPWKVVVLDDSGSRHYWHRVLPDDRRAEDQASTNIVVCLAKRDRVVEQCKYTSRTMDRVQHYVDVTVFNAENLQPISTFQVWGSTPGACPELVTRNTSHPEGDDPFGHGARDYFNTFYTELMKTVQ
jgi:hypothetical protein